MIILRRSGSKYGRLHDRLMAEQGRTWSASFAEIEKILGDSLPNSAYRYSAWWANDRTHVQAQAWLKAGWQVEDCNLPTRVVRFKKL